MNIILIRKLRSAVRWDPFRLRQDRSDHPGTRQVVAAALQRLRRRKPCPGGPGMTSRSDGISWAFFCLIGLVYMVIPAQKLSPVSSEV